MSIGRIVSNTAMETSTAIHNATNLGRWAGSTSWMPNWKRINGWLAIMKQPWAKGRSVLSGVPYLHHLEDTSLRRRQMDHRIWCIERTLDGNDDCHRLVAPCRWCIDCNTHISHQTISDSIFRSRVYRLCPCTRHSKWCCSFCSCK